MMSFFNWRGCNLLPAVLTWGVKLSLQLGTLCSLMHWCSIKQIPWTPIKLKLLSGQVLILPPQNQYFPYYEKYKKTGVLSTANWLYSATSQHSVLTCWNESMKFPGIVSCLKLIQPELSSELWPVKCRNSLFSKMTEVLLRNYWLFVSVGVQGRGLRAIPMKSCRKRSCYLLQAKDAFCVTFCLILFSPRCSSKIHFANSGQTVS